MVAPQDNESDRRRNRGRLALWIKTIGLSLLISGTVVLVLMLVVFPPPPEKPPSFTVALREADQPDEIENLTVQKFKRAVDSENVAAGMILPVTAVSSPFAIEVSEFDSPSLTDVPGLLSGFQTGDGSGGLGRGGDGIEGSIGGMKVRAVRLGVVLDVSGSMKEELRSVRKELNKEFGRAKIVEVEGCSLTWSLPVEFDPRGSNRRLGLDAKASSVLTAIEILIVRENVDAIFWFSDLQDKQEDKGLRRLVHLLGMAPLEKKRRPVRFYVRSVERTPTEALKAVALRSGGAVRHPQRKRRD